ncbi:MAG: substrate-binding domain-containing protein [Gammaproteobacteria bacterium]|nr:substrate-binding domain-containing protein [Gammaproteobacteria bacterium]
MQAGYGVDRKPVMHDDFVIIGPADDPANVAGTSAAAEALQAISRAGAIFVSRGDDSGTHKKEKQLWSEAGIEPGGDWYLAVGQGMGAVLQIADDRQGYALTDRYLTSPYGDKIELEIVSEGDKALYNPYHIIAVNPERHPHVKYDLATDYIDFVTGEEGQKIIRDYRMQGQQLSLSRRHPRYITIIGEIAGSVDCNLSTLTPLIQYRHAFGCLTTKLHRYLWQSAEVLCYVPSKRSPKPHINVPVRAKMNGNPTDHFYRD